MKDRNFKIKETNELGYKTLWLQFYCKDGSGGSIALNNIANEQSGITKNIMCRAITEYLSEEQPEKIQSEYEWREERYKLLQNRDTSSEETAEYLKLQRWLEGNKPEQWEICTKENTKVGDEVIFGDDYWSGVVEYISVNRCRFIVSKGVFDAEYSLDEFKINTYKE